MNCVLNQKCQITGRGSSNKMNPYKNSPRVWAWMCLISESKNVTKHSSNNIKRSSSTEFLLQPKPAGWAVMDRWDLGMSIIMWRLLSTGSLFSRTLRLSHQCPPAVFWHDVLPHSQPLDCKWLSVRDSLWWACVIKEWYNQVWYYICL